MSLLTDILEALKGWNRWKQIEGAPEKIEALERRVTELESRLQRAPGEACPRCGALDYRTMESRPVADAAFAKLGAREHVKRCGACAFEDVVSR